ncbi:uncharacterized protein LOC122531846 [Frieseomelitta varia]|uniref:uncharacterized protein LOC122531846 n=1 Tax=Frieseomelitta varia TaxID=561572 RepID=UPI001CB694CC|nr:uncharacterized protein LOC122531846 [Frieseomelitta varia]
MPRKLLVFTVILFNFILYIEGKAIVNPNFQSNVINSASRAQDQYVNKNFDFKAIETDRLSGKINHNACTGDCNEKDQKKFLSESKHVCPYESKELCLIFSLSKIAKVQVATLNQPSTYHNLKSNIFDSTSKDTRNSKINGGRMEDEQLHSEFINRNKDKYSQNLSERQTKLSSIHCRAIRDVYIPEVKQNLPAFACKFGNNTFILSSERFLQDQRSHLNIGIDENIFKNIKTTPKISEINGVNVIPALLVLNLANNNYRIEMHKNIYKNEKVNQSEGSR